MRTFTLSEANELLPQIRSLAERMVERKRALDEAEAGREALRAQIATNGGDITPSDVSAAEEAVVQAAGALAAVVQEIQGVGVLVKDLDTGLVDFPSLREGELVLLCWRLGEDEIGYWHGTDEGYAGRKPV